MIRKLARIEAPIDSVLEVLRDTDSWPQWMPGVAATRTLASGDDHRLVEVILLVFGRRLVQKLECREQDGRLTHRQVAGWFRRWQASWELRPPPDGPGTILSMELEFDLGVASLFVPRRLFHNWVSELISDTIEQAGLRAKQVSHRRREPTQAVKLGLPLLTVYETVDGFEVHFAGRTFRIDATDPLDSLDEA